MNVLDAIDGIVDAMVSTGCTVDQIAAAVKAVTAQARVTSRDEKAAEETLLRTRELARERQRRRREGLRPVTNRDVTHVTLQPLTSPPVPPDKVPPTPPEINPPISPPPISEREPEKSPADASSPPKPKPKPTRIPADWSLPKSWGEWAMAEFAGIDASFIRTEAAKFHDHFLAASGRVAIKLDWQATWRNWMRRAWEERGGGGRRPIPPAGESALKRRERELAERVANEHGIGRERGSDHQAAQGLALWGEGER